MAKTVFGPGTLTFTVGGTPVSFQQEVKSGGVIHAYEDVGDPVKYLDGSGGTATRTRGDSLSFEVDFDLAATGLYNFLQTNDLKEATFVYIPNTVDGAQWTGTVVLTLPDGATAESFGAKHSGTIELAGSGIFPFTPSTAAP